MNTGHLTENTFHAVVPAAGSGSRMGSATPKQYLPLLGRPVLRHTLDRLLSVPSLAAVWVVLSPDDADWTRYDWPEDARLRVLRVGGASRAASVANALTAISGETSAETWVLVHDAARACVDPADVENLISTLANDPVGGILAAPLADTLKRADGETRVAQTIPREGLWLAQTPQMFRLGLLQRALAAAPNVTDEAGAIEALGLAPRLVPGKSSNFKLTYPEDLALAARILSGEAERKEA